MSDEVIWILDSTHDVGSGEDVAGPSFHGSQQGPQLRLTTSPTNTYTNCASLKFEIMAAGQKMYPRATVKKIVKAHSKCNVSKNVDVMIFLDYVLFMQTLVKEATIDSKQAGERSISAKSIRKVTPDTLAKFKG
ncbi:hypothetical protein E0Z10_g9308 [Xylaria hypoxylon]|uniref:Transcription factor CBF/NF-Y/archaeal histone domain-containing protein n=1 Tax=Xylaria hypoxylon TaxID=37992 RepID=A0A4Z0Y5Y1_9PEZI|nr:hypothetical protein E0Z10_g9308 [Xylaria hypoxylon]